LKIVFRESRESLERLTGYLGIWYDSDMSILDEETDGETAEHAATRAAILAMAVDAEDFSETLDGPATEWALQWAAAKYVETAQTLVTRLEGEARHEFLRTMIRDFSVIRKGDRAAERIAIEREHLAFARERLRHEKERLAIMREDHASRREHKAVTGLKFLHDRIGERKDLWKAFDAFVNQLERACPAEVNLTDLFETYVGRIREEVLNPEGAGPKGVPKRYQVIIDELVKKIRETVPAKGESTEEVGPHEDPKGEAPAPEGGSRSRLIKLRGGKCTGNDRIKLDQGESNQIKVALFPESRSIPP
jgi:hypothetical protein